MHLFLKFSTFILFSFFLFLPSCIIEPEDPDEDEVVISNQIAIGSTDVDEPFTTVSSVVVNEESFGTLGYTFKLFREEKNCDSSSNSLSGDIGFFIESAEELTAKAYEGNGPFINNSSFFGCDVIITSVTATTISGKVKGGNLDGDKWVEGAFTATICE